MDAVIYGKITADNFSLASLDSFIGRQEISACWRRVDGIWKLLPIAYTDDSVPAAQAVLDALLAGNPAFGAWAEGRIMGLALLNRQRFGSRGQYVDLAEFHVSLPFRRWGIGQHLFRMACQGARELGVEKLYISARESIAAYRKYSCVEAKEIHQALAEKEPCDVPLEFPL